MNSCQVGEFKILYISYFSFVLYFSLFGSVKSNYGLFLISGIRLFHDGTLSITRTLMANLVDKDLHGTLFVIPGILQSIATSGGALTYSTLYKAGVINFLVIIWKLLFLTKITPNTVYEKFCRQFVLLLHTVFVRNRYHFPSLGSLHLLGKSSKRTNRKWWWSSTTWFWCKYRVLQEGLIVLGTFRGLTFYLSRIDYPD